MVNNNNGNKFLTALRLPLFIHTSSFFILLSSCSVKRPEPSASFSFNNPEVVHKLPAELYEISGITAIDSVTLACVQDEQGIIFQYNLGAGRVAKTSPFYLDGDYEGIAKADNDLFVLRSDGTLFHLSDFMSGNVSVTDSIATDIPISNNEGLCFDPLTRCLLIASKGRVKGNKELKDKRFVFGFQIDSKSMLQDPVITLDVNIVAAFMQRKGMEVRLHEKKNGSKNVESLKLMPSGIAVSPNGEFFFLLSAVDRLLLKLDRYGDIVDVIELKESLYSKPEGLIFLPNGKLVISNEGHGGVPNLVVVGIVD